MTLEILPVAIVGVKKRPGEVPYLSLPAELVTTGFRYRPGLGLIGFIMCPAYGGCIHDVRIRERFSGFRSPAFAR